MSSPSEYEPIGPGGGKTDRALRRLWPLVWLLVVYFAIAWWRGEPPSWRTVFNVVSVAAAALALLGWKGSAEGRRKRRLKRLFQSGRVPDVTEVMALLEGIDEDEPVHDVTQRYALGMISPEEYFREMAELLGVDRPLSGVRAAMLLTAVAAVAAVASADKLTPTLEELVDEADLIVVGEVTSIEEVDGWRVGEISVERLVSHHGGETILYYLAEPTWSCDTTRGEVGGRYLFLLQRPEDNLGDDHLGGKRGVPPTYSDDGQVYRVAWSGTGQIDIYRDTDGERAGLPVSDAERWELTRTLGKRPGTVPLDEVIDVLRSVSYSTHPRAEEWPEVLKRPAGAD